MLCTLRSFPRSLVRNQLLVFERRANKTPVFRYRYRYGERRIERRIGILCTVLFTSFGRGAHVSTRARRGEAQRG